MKEVYLLAIEGDEPAPLQALQGAFTEDDVVLLPLGERDWGFHFEVDERRIEVRFRAGAAHGDWQAELLTGSEEAHAGLRRSRGSYQVSFRPGGPQPTVAVFEALWCVRRLQGHTPGVLLDVTALKLHEPEDVAQMTELDFDIRDHVNLHVVEATEGVGPLWVHSHGMEKFGARDVEVFRLDEDDLPAAEGFLHELCTGLAFGQGPQARAEVGTSEGQAFTLLPSEEARANLLGVPLETFEGHGGRFLTVVAPGGRHTIAALLQPYRERFESEPQERSEALQQAARELLPAFKARFQRRGLMEPLTFLVRVPLETHPEGEPLEENLWLEVLGWDGETVTGKLVDGAVTTTEWRKGVHVEVEEAHVNALTLHHEGRALDEAEMRALLVTERPM